MCRGRVGLKEWEKGGEGKFGEREGKGRGRVKGKEGEVMECKRGEGNMIIQFYPTNQIHETFHMSIMTQ